MTSKGLSKKRRNATFILLEFKITNTVDGKQDILCFSELNYRCESIRRVSYCFSYPHDIFVLNNLPPVELSNPETFDDYRFRLVFSTRKIVIRIHTSTRSYFPAINGRSVEIDQVLNPFYRNLQKGPCVCSVFILSVILFVALRSLTFLPHKQLMNLTEPAFDQVDIKGFFTVDLNLPSTRKNVFLLFSVESNSPTVRKAYQVIEAL